MTKYKCEACGMKRSNLPNSLCQKCQAGGYFYRWGTLMRDKRVGRTEKSKRENLKKLIKGKDIWGGIEEGYVQKHGGLEY